MTEKILKNTTVLAGRDLEPIKGYLRIDDGIIQEIGKGEPGEPGADLRGGYVIPPFVNAHTHIGDSVLKEIYRGKSQGGVVGKGGKKFEALKSSSDREMVEAMEESILEMRNSGTLAHCDFRENGIEGTKLINQAKIGVVETLVLPRPAPSDDLGELLSISDGIGVPSLNFLPPEGLKSISDEVSRGDKLLAFHASETKSSHEKSLEETGYTEIQCALDFEPSFLVHATWANEDDLDSLKSAEVPLVFCPRSNSLLSTGLPPIKEALEKEVEIWLGTDNVTVCSPIMFQELSFAWSILRLQSDKAGSQAARELLKAATVNPTDDLDLSFGPLKEGDRASFLVLARKRNLARCDDPHVAIVNRARVDNVEMVYRAGEPYEPVEP